MTGAIIGVFGGTFDPFHNGHLNLLDTVLQRLPVSVIHVIPASVPPLREQPEAGAGHRAAMVRCAIEGRDRLVCDTREIDREGTSYTVLTLESLKAEYPGDRLVLILGRDQFDKLPKWHRFEEIRKLADLVVINRPGAAAHESVPQWLAPDAPVSTFDPAAPVGQVVFLAIPPRDISATELRRRLAGGGDVSGMIPDTVYSYIKANRLYG